MPRLEAQLSCTQFMDCADFSPEPAADSWISFLASCHSPGMLSSASRRAAREVMPSLGKTW
jgi:hypothetical protein